jgi:hypothetical protein
MNTQVKGNFDFTAINTATKALPAGMKLAIAEGLLITVIKTLNHFHNELETDAQVVLENLQALKAAYKTTKLKSGFASKEDIPS